MFHDFLKVSDYGKLSAKFLVGRLRLIEMVEFVSFFFYFLLEQLLIFVLNQNLTCSRRMSI